MAKTRTVKSCYKSRYNDSFVTPAQYITELICEKHAQIDHGDLPRQFWKLKKWVDKYRYQIKYAYQLVKDYPHKAIVKALLDPRTKTIYSLAHPLLLKIIQEYAIQLANTASIFDDEAIPCPTTVVTKSYENSNSKLNKLREFEDGL